MGEGLEEEVEGIPGLGGVEMEAVSRVQERKGNVEKEELTDW